MLTTPSDYSLQFLTTVPYFTAPQLIFAPPGRFNKEQFGLANLQLLLPIIRCKLVQLTFGRKGTIGKVIHNAGHTNLLVGFIR